jgi:nitroreductase
MTSDSTLHLTSDEVLTTTRSVRKRLDLSRPVPPELIRECLEVARQAPTGGNQQTWHFIVVTDAAKRAAIGDHYRRSYEAYRNSGDVQDRLNSPDPAKAATAARVTDSATYLSEHMGEVPALVIAAIDAGTPSLPASNQAGLWGSILPAAWSYMLAARDRGLGSAWTTLHLRYESEIRELLGIPDTVHQGVLLPTAYFTGETFKPVSRPPLEDVLHLDTW